MVIVDGLDVGGAPGPRTEDWEAQDELLALTAAEAKAALAAMNALVLYARACAWVDRLDGLDGWGAQDWVPSASAELRAQARRTRATREADARRAAERVAKMALAGAPAPRPYATLRGPSAAMLTLTGVTPNSGIRVYAAGGTGGDAVIWFAVDADRTSLESPIVSVGVTPTTAYLLATQLIACLGQLAPPVTLINVEDAWGRLTP